MSSPTTASAELTLRPSTHADIDWLVEVRAVVLRDDLERLGVYDPVRVRERMRSAFAPEHTRVIVVDGVDVGSITTRADAGIRWIEHFYLAPRMQGRGFGARVLNLVVTEPYDGITKLNVLQGSPARRLYERAGFIVETEDDVDVYMRLGPVS